MKNVKARTLWSRNLRRISPNRLNEMRREIGVPEGGFVLVEEGKMWERKAEAIYLKTDKKVTSDFERKVKNKSLSDEPISKLLKFEEEIKREFPELEGFSEAIENLIIFGSTEDSVIDTSNATGCSIEFVTEATRKIPTRQSRVIDDGVYIKISAHTSLKDIDIFLNKSSTFLSSHKNFVYKGETKKVRTENFERNEMVFDLSKYSIMKLKSMYNLHTNSFKEVEYLHNKDSVACAIMKLYGYEISTDNFKQIAHREKNRRASR